LPQPHLIACVDDDTFVREALEGLFVSAGYSVLTFASAEDFLGFAGIDEVSCLVTDMKLGGLSGVQLLRQLTHEGHAIPAIVITAFGDEQLREQSLAAGAAGFFHKPVRDEELLVLVEAVVDRSKT
jgi:FixJ family two-component response regulator